MDYRKFDDWSRAGYKILKGSKATWIDGVPMFSREQVVPRPARQWRQWPSWMQADYDYDDPMTFDNWMGKH